MYLFSHLSNHTVYSMLIVEVVNKVDAQDIDKGVDLQNFIWMIFLILCVQRERERDVVCIDIRAVR